MKRLYWLIFPVISAMIILVVLVLLLLPSNKFIGTWTGGVMDMAAHLEEDGQTASLVYSFTLSFDKSNQLVINATSEYGGKSSSVHNYYIMNKTVLLVSGYMSSEGSGFIEKNRSFTYSFEDDKLHLTGRIFTETEDREMTFMKVK